MARIIIVDDDEILTDLLGELFGAQGHLVSAVHDGGAAVDAIRAAEPDLVVLDYALPGITGMEILRQFREEDRLTPVIMLTARTGRIHDGRARREGASDYLTKPFDPAVLIRRVETLLALARAARLAA